MVVVGGGQGIYKRITLQSLQELQQLSQWAMADLAHYQVEQQESQLVVMSIQQWVVVTAQHQIIMEEMDHHQVELAGELHLANVDKQPGLTELVGVAELVVAILVNQLKELLHSPATHHSPAPRRSPPILPRPAPRRSPPILPRLAPLRTVSAKRTMLHSKPQLTNTSVRTAKLTHHAL